MARVRHPPVPLSALEPGRKAQAFEVPREAPRAVPEARPTRPDRFNSRPRLEPVRTAPLSVTLKDGSAVTLRALVTGSRRDNPRVAQAWQQLGTRIGAEQPQTVGALLKLGRSVAVDVLKAAGAYDALGPARETAVTGLALVALAAHAKGTRAEGSARFDFPRFIPVSDGSDGFEGRDKTAHVLTQAAFAFEVQLDAQEGKGELLGSLDQLAATFDPRGRAEAVAAAYERVKGAAGSLLPGASAAPYEARPVYFPRPKDLGPQEGRIYDALVRIGDGYEDKSTLEKDPARAGYAPDSLGTHPEWTNPLLPVENTDAVVHGLADRGVTRDLTADRVGAWLGLALFREPATVPSIPFDEGPAFDQRPFSPGVRGSLGSYLAVEEGLLSRLGVTPPPPAHSSEAALLGRMDAAVDALAATDRETLAAYYANFAVRQLSMGVSFGGGPGEAPDFATHQAFARTATPEALKAALHRRVGLIAGAYQLRTLDGLLGQRLLFEPLGKPSSSAVPFGGGALLDLATKSGPARLVATPQGATYFLPPAITARFDAQDDAGRYLRDTLGLPIAEARADGGRVTQPFEGGTVTA